MNITSNHQNRMTDSLYSAKKTKETNPQSDEFTAQMSAFHLNPPPVSVPEVNPEDLTQEQLDYLEGKYQFGSMSEEDYQNFLDDLVEMGILTDSDKDYVDPSRPTAVAYWDGENYVTGEQGLIYLGTNVTSPIVPNLEAAKGNLYDWLRHETVEKEYFGEGWNIERDKGKTELFQRIEAVLNRIQPNSNSSVGNGDLSQRYAMEEVMKGRFLVDSSVLEAIQGRSALLGVVT